MRVEHSGVVDAVKSVAGETQSAYGLNLLQDFAISVERVTPGYIPDVFMFIWLAGVFAVAITLLICNRKLRLIKKTFTPISDSAIAALLSRSKAELGIKKDIPVGTSIFVKSPMSLGILRPLIVLPDNIAEALSANDIRLILLHELTHCKNSDILINALMCLFQVVYWFNPFVHLAFKQMRQDRELACDFAVLNRIPQDGYIDYGKILLRFVGRLSARPTLSLVTDMCGSKPLIHKRVKNIASHKKESKALKAKSVSVFVMTLVLILSQVFAISAFSSNSNASYRLTDKNIVYEDLSAFFGGFDGSFVLYDTKADSYTIYNKEKSVERVSPDSTYKIYSALIALETGVISTTDSQRKWDGTTYPVAAWNQNHNLASAVNNSVNWYFQNTDKSVGQENLKAYLKRLKYGNCDLSADDTDFWLESSLRISPVEQVNLLKDFYRNETIFKPEYVDALKDILRLSEKSGAALSGKTGTGSVNGSIVNGWFIGYVENAGRTVIFATNIQGKDSASGSAATKITLEILKNKEIY